jgi:signal peptidase II
LKALVLLAALLLFGVDQFTKWLVMQTMDLHESIPVLGQGPALTYIRNTGGAFGLLPGGGPLFVITGVLVLVGLLWALPRMERWGWLTGMACALILGGTLGNLVDRMRFGAVVDFIDLKVWPIFNVADMGISVGIGLLVWQLLFRPQRPAPSAPQPVLGPVDARPGPGEDLACQAGGPAPDPGGLAGAGPVPVEAPAPQVGGPAPTPGEGPGQALQVEAPALSEDSLG